MLSRLFIFFIFSSMLIYSQSVLIFEQKSIELLKQMTLEEKVHLLGCYNNGVPRLGISPIIMHSEALHGIVTYDERATVFPIPMAMAATFNPDLVYLVGDAVSDEARVVNKINNFSLSLKSPVMDITRDPRWGRSQETYGEDPYLISRMGSSYIKGLQGNNKDFLKVLSFPKHFTVYSGPEPTRYGTNVTIGERDLRESYLPGYKAALTEGGAKGLMTSYSALNGVPCTANEYLLKTILRKEWKFDGILTTDGWGIGYLYRGHQFVDNFNDAMEKAITNGVDLDLSEIYQSGLSELCKLKPKLVEYVDSSIVRILKHRFMLGEFEKPGSNPFNIPDSALDSKKNRELAKKVAIESMVLLKNKDNILPLSKDLKRVLVLGPNSRAEWNQHGAYPGFPSSSISFLTGLINKLPKTKFDWIDMYLFPYFFAEVLSPKCIETDDGKPGLKGEYFNNPNLSGKPALTRIDTLIDFDWKLSSPAPEINPDNFSVRWTGYFTPRSSEEFVFRFSSDDGIQLKINDSLIINNWRCNDFVSSYGYKQLDSGKKYKIEILYFDSTLNARIRAEYGGDETSMGYLSFLKDSVKNYDAIFFVGGINTLLESEHNSVNLKDYKYGDRLTLTLPRQGREVLEILKKSGKKLIFAYMGGSSFDLTWENDNLDAIINTWYSGEEGGNAFADIVFGDANPSGKLPLTFYKSIKDLPDFNNYSFENRTYRFFKGEPLFPFGFGLSYTSFNISDLKLEKYSFDICKDDTAKIYFNLKNTGTRDGAEVVQVYVAQLNSKVPQPIKQLKGFKKLFLKSNISISDSIKLNLHELYYYDTLRKDYFVEPGNYEIQIGNSSESIFARDTIFIDNCTVRVDDDSKSSILFPNPGNDKVYLKLPPDSVYQISIFNSLGDKVKFLEYNLQNSIDISDLPIGYYIIKIKSSVVDISERLIISR